MERNNSINQEAQLLAKVYAIILSWHDPPQEKTAGSENLGRDTEPAVRVTPTKQEDVE